MSYGNVGALGPIANSVNTATPSTSTTSTATISGITTTLTTGNYLVWFDCDINSATGGSVVTIGIYVNGAQTTNSQRKFMPFAGGTLTAGNQRITASVHDLITVSGSQTVDVRWSSSSAGMTTAESCMSWLKVVVG